jgi:hypothetical protein
MTEKEMLERMSLNYISGQCKECGNTVYGGAYCSRVCEDTYADKIIKYGHSFSGKTFKDLDPDLPTFDEVKSGHAGRQPSNLREELIEQRKARQKAKLKLWEEMRQQTGI